MIASKLLQINPAVMLIAAGLCLALAACSPQVTPPPEPTLTPRPNALPTLASLPPESTLPPTWTPTFTPSPEPPTVTPSPTLTLSPEPTLSAQAICDSLEMLYEIPNNERITKDKVIPIALMAPVPDVIVQFSAIHSQTKTGQGLQLPGGGMVIAEFPLSLLTETGRYTWQLVILSEHHGELCEQEGAFTLLEAAATPEPETTPEVEDSAE